MKALARTPRRVRSLQALEQAAAGLGEREVAERTRKTLRQIWHRADPGVSMTALAAAKSKVP